MLCVTMTAAIKTTLALMLTFTNTDNLLWWKTLLNNIKSSSSRREVLLHGNFNVLDPRNIRTMSASEMKQFAERTSKPQQSQTSKASHNACNKICMCTLCHDALLWYGFLIGFDGEFRADWFQLWCRFGAVLVPFWCCLPGFADFL